MIPPPPVLLLFVCPDTSILVSRGGEENREMEICGKDVSITVSYVGGRKSVLADSRAICCEARRAFSIVIGLFAKASHSPHDISAYEP